MRLLERVGPPALKVAAIGAVTLLMLWPLAQVRQLIDERRLLEQAARERIAAVWGGAQLVAGPVLQLPAERIDPSAPAAADGRPGRSTEASPLQQLPARLEVDAEVEVTRRRSGIYSMPVYRVRVVLSGRFDTLQTLIDEAALGGTERAARDRARVAIPVVEPARVLAVERFEVGGRSLDVRAGKLAGGPALIASLSGGALGNPAAAIPFRIEYTLAGSGALRFVPTARDAQVAVGGAWTSPRFSGRPAATAPRIGSGRFSATWRVLELQHGLPAAWRGGTVSRERLEAASFGLDLHEPVDVYARNWRAVRYGVLFIALTFLCLFVWEHGGPARRLHPFNYALVGLALTVFYLLLLATSEHVGFGWAYAGSASALIALIGWYSAGSMRSWRPALALAGALAAAYAALYAVLDSEDYALLMGAAMVFAALATLMISTRRLDWSRVASRE